MENTCAIIMAAGDGKRTKSSRPKALSKILFTPILQWIIAAVKAAGVEDICVVAGSKHEAVEEFLARYDDSVEIVRQEQRLGTSHAVKQAWEMIEKHAGGNVLILRGDCPLIDAESIHDAYEAHLEENNAVTVISSYLDDPEEYDRILRSDNGRLLDILDEDAIEETEEEIQEIDTGACWFQCDELLPQLENVGSNEQQEYRLRDLIKDMIPEYFVNAYPCDNSDFARGFSNCLQLNQLNQIARRYILEGLMLDGVEIPCTDGIMIGPNVQIGRGTVILPGTILKGDVKIGEECVIGPNTLIEDSIIGDETTLNSVQCFQSVVESHASIGPFVHLRPNSHISQGVKIGDFVEVKNAVIGKDTKIAHLTYVGDSDVGERVNFGCGCVTVNYDGVNKHRCTIGNDVFLGCNTNLVAPVTLEDGAYTAAGSTITENVPPDSLAIARARQVNKEGWVTANGKRKTKK